MRRRVIGAGLLAAVVFALPGAESLAQNKKKGDPEKPKGKTVDSAKLPAREYAGKLGSVPGTDRVFLVEMESKSAVPTIRNGGRNRPAIGYKTTTTWTEVEFQTTEKVKVRTMVLPDQFDEKGNLKKYTSKMLAELRGKDSQGLPGYESSLDKLEAGQRVSVQLVAAPARAAKAKDKEDAGQAEKRMQVRLIVILAEASAEGARPKDRKK
jgi:hypothetical protein